MQSHELAQYLLSQPDTDIIASIDGDGEDETSIGFVKLWADDLIEAQDSLGEVVLHFGRVTDKY